MRYRFTKDEIGIRQGYNGTLVLSMIIDGQLIECAYMYYSQKEAIKRFQQEFGVYPNDYKPAGILTLCNFGGLAVMEFENGIDTYAYVTDHYGDGYKNLTKNKIYYNAKGNPYFVRYGRRYYLNNFMRV